MKLCFFFWKKLWNCVNFNFFHMKVWQNYTCTDAGSSSCTYNRSTINPIIYNQLVMAANVSYALYYYTPLLLNLQDCKFVRDTFSTITTQYCPNLEGHLRLVCAGLALISTGVLLCLVLWVFYANRPRRVEEFVPWDMRDYTSLLALVKLDYTREQ